MYLFGTARAHDGPRASSKIMKSVPNIFIVLLIVQFLWEGGVFIQFGRSICSSEQGRP